MRLYFYGFVMLIERFILRRSTGQAVRHFAERMGVVYIKFAQILAMQNIGQLFTESDRAELAAICDHCNPVAFTEIKGRLEAEYRRPLTEIFQSIDENPLGSASISQVHRAVLLDGRIVAVKVKRADVVKRVQHDVRQAKRFIHRFGRFAKFRNLIGSDRALEYYADWIGQEIDFEHEQHNLERYQTFAKSVNGRVAGAKKIVTPHIYRDLCTPNVIIMEYVSTPTINQLSLTKTNKARITCAINDYLRLSFYALLNGLPVVFHGDPHGGNIYLDVAGNIGFLDMGLIFEFDGAETNFIRHLFLDSYTKHPEDLLKILLEESHFDSLNTDQLTVDMRVEIERFQEIPVTQFFVDMIGIFTKYDVAPPKILFKMAKAFIALFGITTFTGNTIATRELLLEQVTEFYIRRTGNDFKNLLHDGLTFLPSLICGSATTPPSQNLANHFLRLSDLNQQLTVTLNHLQEVMELVA